MGDDAADEVAAARLARGDVAAFVELYDRYAPRLHAWALHTLGPIDAEDAVQEVFLHMWERASQFQPDRGRFRSWLMAIARHELGRRLRRFDQARSRGVADRIEEILASAPDPAPGPGVRVEEQAVLERLRLLPLEQRRVLVLGYFMGMSQSAMAHELGIPLGTVKKRVRLGMQKLRTAYGQEQPDGTRLRLVRDL